MRQGAAVTVARRLPVRWDVACRTALPRAGRLRVAQQIRQDLWRALRAQRGFAPCVEVVAAPEGLQVRAGGQVDGGHNARHIEAVISRVLTDAEARRRWVACADAGRSACGARTARSGGS